MLAAAAESCNEYQKHRLLNPSAGTVNRLPQDTTQNTATEECLMLSQIWKLALSTVPLTVWTSLTWEFYRQSGIWDPSQTWSLRTCILSRPAGDPQAHGYIHLVHPGPLFYGWESRSDKLKNSANLEKECLGGDKT